MTLTDTTFVFPSTGGTVHATRTCGVTGRSHARNDTRRFGDIRARIESGHWAWCQRCATGMAAAHGQLLSVGGEIERTAPVPESFCAACGVERTLSPSGVVAPHNDGPDPCPGSGLKPVTGDPARDKVRTQAIGAWVQAKATADKLHAEMLASLTSSPGRTATWLDYHQARVVIAETIATMWHRVAASGDYWAVFIQAVEFLSRDGVDINQRHGTRSWVSEVRSILARELSAGGEEDDLPPRVATLLGVLYAI